jgi:hypothetical protein
LYSSSPRVLSSVATAVGNADADADADADVAASTPECIE